MDVALEKRQVERAYELLAPVYDFIFDWIFAPGRTAAVSQLALTTRVRAARTTGVARTRAAARVRRAAATCG